jgi:hypothetical protein
MNHSVLATVVVRKPLGSRVKRADAPRVLEYDWGGNDIRWELEAFGSGTA